jgi:biotin-(acetyl-CoA carboxylase) ligase
MKKIDLIQYIPIIIAIILVLFVWESLYVSELKVKEIRSYNISSGDFVTLNINDNTVTGRVNGISFDGASILIIGTNGLIVKLDDIDLKLLKKL